MISLDSFVREAQKNDLTLYGIIVTKNGQRVGEHFWRSDIRIDMNSLSKSVVACAVALAIEEGLFALNDQVIGFFPEKIDGQPSDALRAMTIRHLLTMTVEHDHQLMSNKVRDDIQDLDWTHYYLNYPIIGTPGDRFFYDTGTTFILSAIIQKVTGTTLLNYLKPRLFEPLGIRNPQWHTSPDGISVGGIGLFLNTDEISRFGQLFLEQGMYQGKQLVPSKFLAEAIKKQVDSSPVAGEGRDGTYGYGYQFWQNSWPNSYRAFGLYGQYAIIFPDLNAHIAITAHEEKNPQGILDLVWKEIAPQL